MVLTSEDRDWIEQQALAAGFDLAGVADVPVTEAAREVDGRFAKFVEHGRAGEMEYLKRVNDAGELLRGDLQRSIPWARSVIVCAINYNADAPKSIEPAPEDSGWIARYAWSGQEGKGSDYHEELLPKLRSVERELQQRFGADLQTRCYVDTGPLVERAFAQRAGVGWIGKNTCVLNQQQGSWLLLGVIVTSLELAQEAWELPAADRCGSCTRCIDACPTDALVAPRQMDASRCIAYLTIEKKGDVPEELRAQIGRQVFGCDICQDVCPWNRRAPIGRSGALEPRKELVNPSLEWLAEMDGPMFNRWFRGSPLERTRRRRIQRNVAIAMGNSGRTKFLPRLQSWASEADDVIAPAARWAIAQLEKGIQVD
jgi:epoxyqueuosine reductase